MSCREQSGPDLAILVPDLDMREGVAALLRRHHALRIRRIRASIYRHPGRDSGCFGKAHELLRPLARKYDCALVMFDKQGCGSSSPVAEIEAEARERLERNGWSGRCDVVVIDPELEAWVWSTSPHVAGCLGWGQDKPPLREWLEERGLWDAGVPKPRDPKAAVEAVCSETGRRRRAELYGAFGESVSVRGCQDRSFNRFCEILRRWFPPK